ncbi:MAG: Fe-S cluster assembly protein SufD, partial [Gammaproteobacteria bacterium]|nr:Fe-S cluster assembly protein SufD [Gammaproteobacteria bacterium]
HYTDLKPVADAEFDFSPAATGDAARGAAKALLDTLPSSGGARAVFLDGRLDARLSRLGTGPGIDVSSLAEDWQRFDRIAEHRAGLVGHPLAALNTAFAREGLSIRIDAGVAVREPLDIVFIGSGASGFAQQPRIAIELGADAALEVVVHYVDSAPSASWLNVVTQIAQAEGSRLSLHRLQEHSPQLIHTSLLSAELSRDAALEVGYVDMGGRLTRNDVLVRLAEPGASADLFGLFHASEGQHIDNHVLMAHAAPRTTSSEAFRGIADGNGRGIFNGKVVVYQDAQKVDARQSSDNLLLSDKAEIDTKPELEIYADDVKCSHGATIGELDPEHLFYLRSRGIDADAARGLLTFAFANSILRRLQPDGLRERATTKVAGYLPDQREWEGLR